MAMKEDFKNDLRKNLSFFEQKIRKDLESKDIRELSSCYIDLDELIKELEDQKNKIKKYLSKKKFYEEFPEKEKGIQNVDGRSKSYISKEKLLENFYLEAVVEMASVTEKSLREFLIKEEPRLKEKENEKELSNKVDQYKVVEGKGSPSIRVFKLKG